MIEWTRMTRMRECPLPLTRTLSPEGGEGHSRKNDRMGGDDIPGVLQLALSQTYAGEWIHSKCVFKGFISLFPTNISGHLKPGEPMSGLWGSGKAANG
jgi:hypothetical protein